MKTNKDYFQTLVKASLFLSFNILLACVNSPALIDEHVRIGKDLEASRYSQIYFSAQPSSQDLDLLKKQGFVAIINLRTKSEYDEPKEADQIKSLGLSYKNIPFDSQMKLDNIYIDNVTDAIMKYRSQGKILVHCSSGNRVGIWLGGHFYKDHNYSKEKSAELAEKLGLKNDEMKLKLQHYFKEAI